MISIKKTKQKGQYLHTALFVYNIYFYLLKKQLSVIQLN